MAPIAEAQDVSKTYRLGSTLVEALRGISLEVAPGDFLAIAGPSGSGKTTLLNLLGCLDAPSAGRVVIDGEPVASLSADRLAELRARKIGFVFQTFNLIPVLSAFENVEYPLLIRKLPGAARRAAVVRALSGVGLSDVAAHRPAQLSGGQQQRVAIARALVGGPSLVLADEPTANLDSKTAQEIIDLMLLLNRTEGVTFVFSTHDSRVIRLASRVVEIRDGRIAVEAGPRSEPKEGNR
jgi:putative ABC transport system ATP-binding protein